MGDAELLRYIYLLRAERNMSLSRFGRSWIPSLRVTSLFAAGILLLFLCVPVAAESQRVSLVAHVETSENQVVLAHVAQDAVQQYLEQHGYVVEREEPPVTTATIQALKNLPRREQALLARNVTLLSGQFSGSLLYITVTWYDRMTDSVKATVTDAVETDLYLDRSLFAIMDRVISARATFVFETPANFRVTSEFQPQITPGYNQQLETSSQPARYEFGVSVSPFIGAGSLAPYFQLAVGTGTRLSRRIPKNSIDMAVGLTVSCIGFEVQGPGDSGKGLFVPTLVDVRVGGKQSPGGIVGYLRVSGGAALLVLSSDGGPDLLTVLPGFGAGIGATLTMHSGTAISAETYLLSLVDGKDLILGLTPGVEVTFPLRRR